MPEEAGSDAVTERQASFSLNEETPKVSDLEKFREQLKQYREYNGLAEESDDEDSTTGNSEHEKVQSGESDLREHAIKCSEIFLWGSDSCGQLGHGLGRNVWEPTVLKLLRFADFEYASSPTYKISCGFGHSAAVSDIGLFTWGSGEFGQLGHGENTNESVPKLVEALSSKRVRRVACGTNHTICLNDSGAVYSWGRGKNGRLGHGDDKDCLVPKEIECLRNKSVVQISAGGAHCAALTSLGEVWMWGNGMAGQIGTGSKHDQRTPVLVSSLAGKMVCMVACGEHHTAALIDSGEVYTWGFGVHGRLGHGDESSQTVPKQVEGMVGRRAVLISCGGYHTACLAHDTPDGHGADPKDVWTWGFNRYGQLGHGDHKDQLRPKKVRALTGRSIAQVICGSWHTVAITGNGIVYSWGWNEEGQLGLGSQGHDACMAEPRVVRHMLQKRVVQVGCGWSHMMAITAYDEPPPKAPPDLFLSRSFMNNPSAAPRGGSPKRDASNSPRRKPTNTTSSGDGTNADEDAAAAGGGGAGMADKGSTTKPPSSRKRNPNARVVTKDPSQIAEEKAAMESAQLSADLQFQALANSIVHLPPIQLQFRSQITPRMALLQQQQQQAPSHMRAPLTTATASLSPRYFKPPPFPKAIADDFTCHDGALTHRPMITSFPADSLLKSSFPPTPTRKDLGSPYLAPQIPGMLPRKSPRRSSRPRLSTALLSQSTGPRCTTVHCELDPDATGPTEIDP